MHSTVHIDIDQYPTYVNTLRTQYALYIRDPYGWNTMEYIVGISYVTSIKIISLVCIMTVTL